MQNHVISKRKSHIWSVVLRKNSLHVGGFFCQDFVKKAWERLTTYLATEIRYCLLKLIFFEFFNCSCYKIGLFFADSIFQIAAFSLHFVQVTIAQNTAVLKHRQPRTSDTAICAFKNISRPVCGLIYQELAIFSHFLA